MAAKPDTRKGQRIVPVPRRSFRHSAQSRLGVYVSVAIVSGLLVLALLVLLDQQRAISIEVVGQPVALSSVHITGAVATPGVVNVPPGARVIDAVEAAGGLTDDADTASINLAARIGDGERVDIPVVSTVAPTSPMESSSANANGLMNINTATVEELVELPSIGDVLATRIVAYREIHGPYQSVDDLLNVEGISNSILEEIRPLITVTSGG